jgi:LEA14-like dessication related protein
MTLRNWRLVAAVLIVPSALACDKVVKEVFTPPAVTFQGVRLGALSIDGSRLLIQLGIRNPNRFTLSATHTEYKLFVDDTIVVGQGQSNDSVSVAPHDSTSIVLPLDVAWSDLTQAGGGALTAGEVNYRIVGKITANTPIGAHAIPLDAKGRFNPLKHKQ